MPPLPRRSRIGRVFYGLRYRIGEYALKGFLGSLAWIPAPVVRFVTLGMAGFSFLVLWKYRTRMLENVMSALGDDLPTPALRKALVWRAWKNFAFGVLDTMMVMHRSPEQIRRFVGLEGEAQLTRALGKGNGVIALSAHLGAFTLIGARLGAAGYPFSVVVKHPGDERFARTMTELRARLGINTISAKPRQEAVRGILKALRKNHVVLVIADEFKSGGVEVDFMGQKAAAPRGPASLALRTGAATLPVFAPRSQDGSVTVSVGEEILLVRDDDVEKSVADATRTFTRLIEEAIRKFPDQWNWLGFPRSDRVSRQEYLRRYKAARSAAVAAGRTDFPLRPRDRIRRDAQRASSEKQAS